MANIQHYIFIDESGDPGKPFETDATSNKILTVAIATRFEVSYSYG